MIIFTLSTGGLLVSCSELNEPPPPENGNGSGSVTYMGDIKEIFDSHCIGCHGDSNPNASYSLSTYEGVLGGGSDAVPNAIPGDSTSLLLVKSFSGGSMNGFYDDQNEIDKIERWVVVDSLAEE